MHVVGDYFEFDENGRKFFKREENSVDLLFGKDLKVILYSSTVVYLLFD